MFLEKGVVVVWSGDQLQLAMMAQTNKWHRQIDF
jgi:hypothetical protein